MLMRRLKAGGHKVLIFTQMSKMLDILENFLTLHGHTYLRLDGATKPEERQLLMQRFNTNPKIFAFILSTRAGGVGINLTGADTVVFYDSDWNPAMDAQAQDRCHRIGQTREVHIYRLVSTNTIEENILRKGDQKRQLDFLAIQSGGFNTEILAKFSPAELLKGGGEGPSEEEIKAAMRSVEDDSDAAAAAAVELEVAAERLEFTADEAAAAKMAQEEGGGGKEEEGKEEEGGKEEGGKEEEGEEEQEADKGEGDDNGAMVLAAGGPSNPSVGGTASLQALEASLKPVEKYAVRLIESNWPELDLEVSAPSLPLLLRLAPRTFRTFHVASAAPPPSPSPRPIWGLTTCPVFSTFSPKPSVLSFLFFYAAICMPVSTTCCLSLP